MDPTCSRCRSTKLMSGLHVVDQGMGSDGGLKVFVADRQPDSFFQPKSLFARLRASVCGACGHVELVAVDPAGLYAAFAELRARPSGGLGPDE